jgi:hypothetical protein
MRDGLTVRSTRSDKRAADAQFLCVPCGCMNWETQYRVGCGRAVVYQEARHRAAKQGFRVLYREPQYKVIREVCPSRCGHIFSQSDAVANVTYSDVFRKQRSRFAFGKFALIVIFTVTAVKNAVNTYHR